MSTRPWKAIRRHVASGALVLAGATLAGCTGIPSSQPDHPRKAADPMRSSTTTTTARTSAPTTTSTTIATTSATSPPLEGFSPSSVTFVSADAGWVLGAVRAGSGFELQVAHTTDGGATWSTSPSPDVTYATAGFAKPAIIRFADAFDGWIAAPPPGSTGEFPFDLWSTHDGGATWHEEAVPGGGVVSALEAFDGVFQLVTISTRGTGMELYATPAASDAWVRSATTLQLGAGPVASAQLSLHDGAGWVVEDDRTVVSGARLSSGSWAAWAPPCTDANGGAYLAAASASDLVAVCDEGVWGPPTTGTTSGPWLFTSYDGGSHFATDGAISPPTDPHPTCSSVATPPGEPQVVVIGGTGLVATFDGGRSWKTVYVGVGGHQVVVVGFTTASQGVAIATGGTGPSTLLMTRDGGETWSPATLSRIATS